MKFFADTASLEEIEYCFSREVNDGITTNPSIMKTTGDLSKGFEGACKQILSKYTQIPVSLETDLRGIPIGEVESRAKDVKDVLLTQANAIAQWAPNVVIKIPISEGGLMAVEELYERWIKTNVTACMTPYQALQAAEAGGTYVSLFANRMLDGHVLTLAGGKLEDISGSDWKDVVKKGKEQFYEEAWRRTLGQIAYVAQAFEGTNSSLIVGSIRSPQDIARLASCEPQIITIPTGIVKGLENIPGIKGTKRSFIQSGNVEMGSSLVHPMTDYTLDEFEKAADVYRN